MIDIDALIKRMNATGKGETICLNHDECEALLILLEEREERIAPLRDVEAVVHCKDCKHGEPGACGYGVDCEGIWHDDDWFCADGAKDGDPE